MDLQECQKTARQFGHGTNNLVGIEETFTNTAHDTVEDRTAVTNLLGANISLPVQVNKYTNNLSSKEAGMAIPQKTITNFQGKKKNLKANLNQAINNSQGGHHGQGDHL